MSQNLLFLLENLSDVPVNFWAYLLLAVPPILVFSVKPQGNVWIRTGRLVAAIGCFYVLANAHVHSRHTWRWEAYEKCRSESQHRIDSPEMQEECGHHVFAMGASSAFYFLLGWAPGLVYVGFLELGWRVWHRKKIKAIRTRDLGLVSSSLLIVAALSILLLFLGFLIYSAGI